MDTTSLRNLVRSDIVTAAGYTPGEQANDCIKLNTNESAWPPAPGVRQVLRELADDQLRLYPDPMAQKLCHIAANHFGVRPEQVLAGNGSDDCLTVLYRTHLRPGDVVACPAPTYGLYDTLATIQGVTIEHHDYQGVDGDGDAAWSLPDSLADSDAKLTLVANPNNPSGSLIAREDLCALADEISGILVVDEAYIDFAPAGSSMIELLDQHPNLVVLRTFSKSYSLAGARLGLLFAHADLVAQYRKVKDSYNVNVITQALGCAALQDVDHHGDLIGRTRAGRDDLESLCRTYDWPWTPSAANFVLARVGEKAQTIMLALKERGILVRWWNHPQLSDRLRISVGNEEQHAALRLALNEVVV